MQNQNEIAELFAQLIEKTASATSRKIEDITSRNSEKEEDKILFVPSLAAYLGLKLPTIYAMTSRKEIPFYKKGKKIYFKKSEIDKWIESGRVLTISELDDLADRYMTKRRGND